MNPGRSSFNLASHSAATVGETLTFFARGDPFVDDHLGKQDGFFASRWCNVFYRCFTGIATAFLCPKMPNGARLWWVQHGSPQSVAQETAACTWPCETGRRCSSSGGIVVDSDSTVSESQQEAETVFSSSLCTTTNGSGGAVPGGLSGSADGKRTIVENHLFELQLF